MALSSFYDSTLWQSLNRAEKRYLASERQLLHKLPAVLPFFEHNSYPVDFETAAALDALSRHYVLPYARLRAWDLPSWVCEGWIAKGVARLPFFNPMGLESDLAGHFSSLSELNEFLRGRDYHYGIAMQDIHVDSGCTLLWNIINSLPETSAHVGAAAYLRWLPFGWPSFSVVPLIDKVWLDKYFAELIEVASILVRHRFIHLPSLDPHRLAWHRFFHGDLRLPNARKIDFEQLQSYRAEASRDLRGYRGRKKTIEERPYLHFGDFSKWHGNRSRGNLTLAWLPGLRIDSWNQWVRHESPDDGVVDLYGDLVRPVEHPCQLAPGDAYLILEGGPELSAAIQRRTCALTEIKEAAFDKMVKIDPDSILSPVQAAIVQALKEKGPMTGADLAEAAGFRRRTLYNPNGIEALLDRKIIAKGPKSIGYYLTANPNEVVK